MNDWNLLQRYAEEGSEESFSRLVHQHKAMVYSTCRRYVFDSEQAEDVTQAVFVMLARKSKEIKKGTNLGAWLFKASRFASLEVRRSESRREKKKFEYQKTSSS